MIPEMLNRSIWMLLLWVVVLCSGCGGGGGSSDGVTVISNPGTGSAVIIVTDAPTDEFEQIWVTVTKVELIGSGGHFTLFEGRRVFDLLSLRDDAALLALGRDVPAGAWSKIRLHVEDVELVRLVDEDETVGIEIDCPDGVSAEPGFVCESIEPKVGGNGKIDLNPRGPIDVRAGELVFIQLDLDAVKSVHIHETGNERFQFRPVVFIDAFTLTSPPRLVRLEGTIEEIDLAAQSIVLCGTHRVFRAEAREDRSARSRCVDVRVGPDTSIFDADGEPASLADLDRGDELAALGRFRTGPGEALVFDALWLHEGGFDAGIAIRGEVVGGLVGDEFVIAPEAGPIDADELVVRLAEGAKLFTRAGAPLDPDDLVPGLRVRAFGVLALSNSQPDRLDASLVFAHADAPLERVSGTVTEVFDASDRTLTIHASTEGFVGPLCIALDPGEPVFRTTDAGVLLTSERIEPGTIALGERVTAFGQDDEPCFDADALVTVGP